MVSKREVAAFFTRLFPACPLCKAEANYEISGIAKNYFKCLSCGAKWVTVHEDLDALKVMVLWEPAKDGRGKAYARVAIPVSFWSEFESTKFLCPSCSAYLLRTCSHCKKNEVSLDSACPRCGAAAPAIVQCVECSTPLINENGHLSILTEEKKRELPEALLKKIPVCKYCGQKLLSPSGVRFENGTVAHTECERVHVHTGKKSKQ